ncbi:MAG: transglutaminase domain-containing protein [Phycisphaeraceae bacterium]|nr:transglutaminase domain-containing protein [Phycisphaeraceae bacterium]MCW5769492.1 transglutaminase domain-containing protein [Phycisphaeraceae bacterium]
MRNRVNGGWRSGLGIAAMAGLIVGLSVGTWSVGLASGQSGASRGGGQPSAPDTNPYLRRYDPKDWVLDIRVDVASSQEVLYSPQGQFPTQEMWKFDSAVIVFPILPPTSGWNPLERDGFLGSVTFNDRVRVETFEVLEGYPSGTKLAKWTLEQGGYQGKHMNLNVKISGTGYKVQFNEQEAMKLGWPTTWPAEALNATKPEAYIDRSPSGEVLDMSPVQELVARWTNGKPQSQPPVVTAKWITGQVAELVQVSGSGYGFSRTGKIQGVDGKGAPQTALDRRGSQFDATTLLVACLREAGIPTRMVVGYDVAQDKEERTFLKVKRGSTDEIRCWAEFALYDEQRDILTWVPVDVVAQRKKSSRMPDLKKPWDYFGNNEDLQMLVPFAFQLQPPTTVRYYGTPGFWGWIVMPTLPERAEQWLTLDVTSPSRRGGQPRRN